jgi:hypothetical protein
MERIRTGALLALLGVFPLLLTACSLSFFHPETVHPGVDHIAFRFGDVNISFGSGFLPTGGKAEILGYALACWKVYDVELSGEALRFTFSADYRAPNPTEARKQLDLPNEYVVTGDLSQATLVGNALFVEVFGWQVVDPSFFFLQQSALTGITPLLQSSRSTESPRFVYRQLIPKITDPIYSGITVGITWVRVFENPNGAWYYQILQPRIANPTEKPDSCLTIDFTTWTITQPFFAFWPLAEEDTIPSNVLSLKGGRESFNYVQWLKANLKRP